ncbi:helix-turn-helix domain-containing protein [Halocola ammonii]
MKSNTIAVLPFVNMSADEENEYFSDGITEEIINALARIENLKVISRTSSFYFKGKDIPLKEIARQLDVSTVLEGSVRKGGNQVRITAQLIEAQEDFHYWSETWDRKLENIFEIQDEISLEIADKLREHMGHFEIGEHLVKPQTDNLDAYQYSLKARYHFNKWNPDDVKTAIDLWEKAVELDPNHAESHVGLADAYGFLATTEFLPREKAWKKAAELTHKAIELDPKNAGAHYQLANLSFFTQCDFDDSAKHAFRAIELQPNHPEAQQFVAFLYILCGEMDKARKHLELALDIDPLSKETLFYKAYFLYRTLDFEKALSILNDILDKNDKNIPAIVVKSYCLLQLQRFDEVIELLNSIPEEMVIPNEDLGSRCLTYILSGESRTASEFLVKLEKAAEDPMAFQAHSYLFWAYANLGENDKAFAWVEKAMKIKSSIFLLAFSDPLVNDLKEDTRYMEFHKKLYPPISPKQRVAEEKSSLLDDETAAAYAKNLEQLMTDEEPYLNPGLTLRSLAAQAEIHPNQLSWLLNERFGKNFNSFVNDYRIERFKQLAKDDSNSHISLIGLAYESGFNSKTVFNTYFKKTEGITPREYLKRS